MRHDERYAVHLVFQSPQCRLGWTGYKGYPIHVTESESALLLIEGYVYAPDSSALVSIVARDPDNLSLADVETQLHGFVEEADGDFAVVYLRKRPPYGVVIAVDSLGRLPVYWCCDGSRLLVSREVKFITRLASTAVPDQRGIAETLLLRCPFEERTLVEGVSRLPAGGVLCRQPGDRSLPVIRRFPWCFDEIPGHEPDSDRFVRKLTAEFRDACRRRVEMLPGGKIFLSLSGGLDSRAVAAGLAAAGAHAQARTFLLGSRTNPEEATRAQEVAEACGLSWASCHLSPPTPEAVARLIHLKDGLNSGEMAYAEEYLNSLIAEGGEGSSFFTGEGGDVVVVGRHPLRQVSTCRELGDLLLERYAVFAPGTVAALTGFSEKELRTHLATVLEAYPESRIPGKHLHFTMMVSLYKEYFEGEDRNRAWLWPVAPFYARPFFDLAMTAPVAWKRRRRLQSAFLQELNRQIAAVPNANSGIPPGSWSDRIRQAGRELTLGNAVLERLRRRHRRPSGGLDYPPESIRTRLTSLAESSPPTGEIFDHPRLIALCRSGLTPAQTWLLYTILRYLDMLSGSPGGV